MLPNKRYTSADFLQILKTRAALIVVPAAVGLLIALVISSQLPNVYQAETLIQIVPQRVPDSYVRSTVTIKTEDRLDALSAQVKSRTQLEKMIVELNLYPKQRALQPMQDVVEGMRASISTEVVRPNRAAPIDAFYLRFNYNDPVMAARVTERLGMLYIDYNSRERGALAQGTNEFLSTQLEEAKRRLEDAEKKLRAFSERNSGKLPTQMQSNIQYIQGLHTQRQSIVETLARTRDRQLTAEQRYNDLLATPAPAPVITSDTNSATAVATLSPRQQLERARAALTALEAKLREGHPDLRRARKQVEELEKQVAAMPDAGASTAVASGVNAAEVQRQERLSEIRADIDSLGRQITFGESEERRLNGLIAQYQSRIEAVPGVESEYLKLSREYDTLRDAFKDLLAKSENARVAENLESRQIGEQFRVLDAPRVPLRPISPARPLISGGGLLGGLLVGLLIVALIEIRDGTLKTELDVAQILNLPVIAVVPTVLLETDKQQLARRRWLLSGAAALGTVAAGYTLWVMKLWQFVA